MLHILIQINLKQKKNKYVNTLLYISTRFKSNDNNLLQQKKKRKDASINTMLKNQEKVTS